MKEKLIILSDLWGKENSDWVEYYTQHLNDSFTVEYYDACELAGVDKSVYTQEKLHQQFVNGGIERAVQKLTAENLDQTTIIGFSVGGVIAWKAMFENRGIKTLYSVSSTRLRHESSRPFGNIVLWFGENDPFKPQQDWFDKMELNFHIEPNADHTLYTNHQFAKILCDHILKTQYEI